MSTITALRKCAGLADLAILLNYKPASLAYILYRLPSATKYTTFEIPKRRGGTRTIAAPVPHLKRLQARLSKVLLACQDEINAKTGRKDVIAHGFKRRKSILTNAARHRHKRYVLNVDLADFFGSINFGRVRGFFISNRDFELPAPTATVIAQIACWNNQLPQGAPSSPVISNYIGHLLDVRLAGLAADNRCIYTRYADDLTFSTNLKEFPAPLAFEDPAAPHVWRPGFELLNTIVNTGFRINNDKTRMQYRTSRQEVTGLVVNEKVNVRYRYRRRVRAMVDRLVRNGTFQYLKSSGTAPGSATYTPKPGSLEELGGMLGFIETVDRSNRDRRRSGCSTEEAARRLASKESIYRRFLLFKEIYWAPKPVIFFEGKTDYVYLLHAIRNFALSYPKLAAISGGKTDLLVRLFKYKPTQVRQVLGLLGGAPELKTLINRYHKEFPRFTAGGAENPAIVLIDNDEPAKQFFSLAKTYTKKKCSAADPFVHLFGNMYLVSTPPGPSGAFSCIEDLFDAATLATPIGGKTLSLEKSFDETKHFGKAAFATEVIAKNADTINFGGFAPLLDRLQAAIDDYSALPK